MRLPETERELELLLNAKRSKAKSESLLDEKDFDEAMRTTLICLDTLAQLDARCKNELLSEDDAIRNNKKRFLSFLSQEIPQWKEYRIIYGTKTIPLDFADLSYAIRCKQIHEYSDLSGDTFPICVNWEHRLYDDPICWIEGLADNKVERVHVNGFKLLQHLHQIVSKYTTFYSLNASGGTVSIGDPYFVYKKIGTVK